MSNSTFLRGALPDLPVPGSEEHDRLLQYDLSRLTGNCERLDVVDACRGTGVGREYIGVFQPFDGPCSGEFEPGLPIYHNKNKRLFMYAIDVYPEHWSVRALRGLVRWRIASFKTFADKETCRREEANIFQIDFAADGQPYNYFPTISCFDEFADDFSGFKVSTITIICNDIVVSAPSVDTGDDPGAAGGGGGDPAADDGGDGNIGLVIGIIAIVLLLGAGGYYYLKKQKRPDKDREARKEEKRKSKQAKLEAQRKADEEKARKLFENDAEANLTDSASTEKEEPSKEESQKEVPKFIPVVKPEKHPPVKHQPFNRELPRKHSRRMSTDPPARITAPGGKGDDGVPDDIQKMVADLDNLLDDELKKTVVEPKKPRGRSRSLEPDKASDFTRQKPTRSRSLERAKASAMDYFDRSADAAASLYDGLLKRVKKKDTDSAELSYDADNDDTDRGSRSRSRSIERRKSNDADRGRSRSKERTKSNDYARDRARSRSAERSRASDYAKDRGRSLSKERSKADDYASRDRGRSQERSRASDYAKDRGRSSSKERSKADDYKDRGRSHSKERSKADDYKDRGRSRSKERSKADDYKDRGRSRSKERSKADDYKDRGRSRSKERSKADDYADSKDRGRSRSKERSNADDYAKKRGRSKSIEKHRPRSLEPAGATLQAEPPRKKVVDPPRKKVDDPPKTADSPKAADPPRKIGGYKKLPSGGWGLSSSHHQPIGRSISGTNALDASKAGRTVTKNPDGSVLVSQRRTRDDGAIVTTKTKYANVALARKHGVDV